MDRFFFSLVATALFLSSAPGLAGGSPVVVVRGASKIAPVNPERLLYRDRGAAVLRTDTATEADFQDLYVVIAHNLLALPTEVESRGEVVAFEPGNFALMRLSDDQVETVSGIMHQSGSACGALLKLTGEPIEDAVVLTPTPIIPVTLRDARVEQAVALVSADNIRTTIEELAAITTRYHRAPTGLGIAEILAAKYDALKGDRGDVTVSTYDHGAATPQRSLVVRIEGATRPTEVIVLGSHLDSINGSTGRAPGADDNASGTATNIEIFRVLMAQNIRPERTIEIHAYAAEEIGLVGSQNIANTYRDNGVNVVAMVQHDMNIYKAAGTPDKIWFVSTSTHAGFNDLMTALVDGHVGFPWEKAPLFGGSSDHASWTRAGFAAVFPFENPGAYNRHIHTANDTTANANAFTQAAGFAKLGLSYLAHFGGLN
jgi:leucyl aminopeptidase